MDPLSLFTAVKSLISAFTALDAVRDAVTSEGVDIKEVKALGGLVSLGETLRGKKESPELHALHLYIITQSFGQAVRRFASNGSRTSFLEVFRSSEEKQRQQELERRMSSVVEVLRRPGDMPVDSQEWDLIDSLQEDPLATRYYRALWKSFMEEPSARTAFEPGEKQRFENLFLLSYDERLASPVGQNLEVYLSTLSEHYRPRLLRQLILRDQTYWGQRHVFGNIKEDQYEPGAVPFMALDEMYVEPGAVVRGQKGSRSVLKELHRLLNEPRHSIVVVTADFGMGKSLTARRMARDLSREYLDGRNTSPESWLPVFIQCADDLKENPPDMKQAARRAWKRQADKHLGKNLKLDDQALCPPDGQQKTVFLLDGLDEVALDEEAMVRLFDTLKDEASERHRFIVFSRPGALPSEERLEGIPILELRAWGDEEIGVWLKCWSKLRQEAAPSLSEIEQQGLKELAGTPILLFMLVQTWKKHLEASQANQAALYEDFFQRIAQGKHGADLKHHPVVHNASKALHTRLMKQGLLGKSSSVVEAMLWLMGRVAWEMTRREQSLKLKLGTDSHPLTEEEVKELLEQEELDVPAQGKANPLELIKDGLLLTLQVHPEVTQSSRLMFGHKSFREFLVARYWVARLKALATAPAEQYRQLEKHLLKGRLLSREDRTFEFLMEMLRTRSTEQGLSWVLTQEQRSGVRRWACDCFVSERGALDALSLRQDGQFLLREAALAIASRLEDDEGASSENELTLRSLLAWFWLMRIGPIIIAPRAKLRRSVLAELYLRSADFQGADLSEAILSNSSMRSGREKTAPCDFSGAKLAKAKLDHADLQRALFVDADLTEADLTGANLTGANLTGANLTGALYDSSTIWPEGFDIESAGARYLPGSS